MAKEFGLTVIAPAKTLFEGRAVSLVAPSELGYLGVLADHAPLIANLAAGKITIRKNSGQTEILNCKGKGFLEVLNNSVTMLLI